MEYSQQQLTSSITIVSDTHTTTSPVTTLSVVECLTTSSSLVTSISGQDISAIATTTGMYIRMYLTVCSHYAVIIFTPYVCLLLQIIIHNDMYIHRYYLHT